MIWRPWRKRLADAEAAIKTAEVLRDKAQAQQGRAERMAPRAAAVSGSLERLHTENHFGPLIDAILRGSE